jgi:hypothetical protein
MSVVPTAPTDVRPTTLDDLMIAMDVVDTLRHRKDLVERELDDKGRETDLIERLKKIYHEQGIEVPDAVLAEGVKALAEDRFRYVPAPAGWRRTLLELWVERGRIGAFVGGGLAALAILYGAYYWAYVRPQALVAEATRVEIEETLPAAIRRAEADIVALSKDATATRQAAALRADGERAIRDKDGAALRKVRRELEQLRDELGREYTLTIVARPGETSGVWRSPPTNRTARNYYLIVEAIDRTGQRLALPVKNEETGATETVEKFAVRVPQQTFDKVAADKRDDGIIQANRLATKARGTLQLEYTMPADGGAITQW